MPHNDPAPYVEEAAHGAIATNSHAYLTHMRRAADHHGTAVGLAAEITKIEQKIREHEQQIHEWARQIEQLRQAHRVETHQEGQERNAADVYAYVLGQLGSPLPSLDERVWPQDGQGEPMPLEAQARRAAQQHAVERSEEGGRG